MTRKYPKIHLAVDNCFASKRWTRPSEWMAVISGLGLKCIEASTDTECDPLYMGSEYLEDWVRDVLTQSKKTDLRIVNLYSGHGTYATLGLAHTDPRIRDRFQHEWVEPLIKSAEKLDAGVGFFCHAFNDALLQDRRAYSGMFDQLCTRFSELAAFADEHGGTTIGAEQMYTPHQIPWTISGTFEILKAVHAQAGKPFYVTLDTGHQTGQQKFVRPNESDIRKKLLDVDNLRESIDYPELWLGPSRCFEIVEDYRANLSSMDSSIENMLGEMDAHPYLFSTEEDGNPYRWIEELGCYSPIIHLQQTDMSSSSHRPFTPDFNATGVISGERVLESLAASYESQPDANMPPRCDDIYLTLEIFFATASLNRDIIRDLEKSVQYWRNFVPEDGLTLDQLVATHHMDSATL